MVPLDALKNNALVCPDGACANTPEMEANIIANIMMQARVFLINLTVVEFMSFDFWLDNFIFMVDHKSDNLTAQNYKTNFRFLKK